MKSDQDEFKAHYKAFLGNVMKVASEELKLTLTMLAKACGCWVDSVNCDLYTETLANVMCPEMNPILIVHGDHFFRFSPKGSIGECFKNIKYNITKLARDTGIPVSNWRVVPTDNFMDRRFSSEKELVKIVLEYIHAASGSATLNGVIDHPEVWPFINCHCSVFTVFVDSKAVGECSNDINLQRMVEYVLDRIPGGLNPAALDPSVCAISLV